MNSILLSGQKQSRYCLLETLNKNLDGYARKLGNQEFVAKAPEKVVAEEKRRQAEALENKAKVEEALARIANF